MTALFPAYVCDPNRVCRTCEHFQGKLKNERVVCEHPRWPALMDDWRATQPCAFWERATGADDDRVI